MINSNVPAKNDGNSVVQHTFAKYQSIQIYVDLKITKNR